MPILDLDDSNKTPAEQVVIPEDDSRKLYTDADFKTSTLFNKDHELDTIIRFISGSKWEVDYFLQVRDVNDTLSMPDVNIPSTVLKYNRINNLILNLEGGIDQTDPANVTGSCKINAGFLPNYGDTFIAPLAGGREAVFVVTEVTKQRYNLHEIYEVSFKLFEFLDRDSELYRDLLFKTVREYTYDKNFIPDKGAPIILNQDYAEKLDLVNIKKDIIEYYFKLMVNSNKNLIMVPTNTGVYLDMFINEFMFKIIDTTDIPPTVKVSRLTYNHNVRFNVLDAILERDKAKVKLANKNIGFINTPYIGGYPTTRALGYLNIDYIVDIFDESTRVDIDVINNFFTRDDDYVDVVSNDTTNYIFSDEFYALDRTNCKLFEQAVIDYLNGSLIEMDVLKGFIESYQQWDILDQFYKLPILLVMIKDQIANTYSNI